LPFELKIEKVAEGSFAYFENSLTLQRLRHNHERKQQQEAKQNLHIMEQCAINMPISIGLDKNSPLKERIDCFIRMAIEGGLINKWLKEATKDFASSVEPPPEEAKMDLKKFYGAIVALLCGHFLAIIALLTEIVYWKYAVERHPNYDKYYKRVVAKS